MEPLKGKTLIVPGSSMGIGRALAVELATSGVNLVLNARHPAPLDEVTSQCKELGVRVEQIIGSAAEAKTASDMVDAALGIGSFFGFIQAAGVLHPGPFLWELSDAQFREVFDASVLASHQLIRYAVPKLRELGSGIAVLFGSGASEVYVPGIGAYSAAKSAEEHIARQLAVEAPEITSFAFRPGVVETRMQRDARKAEGGAAAIIRQKFQDYKESGELLTPEEAARALCRILLNDPRRFHGRIVRWSDAP